jgi:hypothetical protein
MTVYLAINNTDVSGTAVIVKFPDLAALKRWQQVIDEITGEDSEPFGWRGEWGVADRVLSPDEALLLIPEEKRTAAATSEMHEEPGVVQANLTGDDLRILRQIREVAHAITPLDEPLTDADVLRVLVAYARDHVQEIVQEIE